MTKLRLGFISIAAALALAVPAFAQQGAFPNYPIVGGAAYCSSTTNGACTNTVPAGPTVLTGNEQLPANTELANGRSPQNVLVTPASLNALPLTYPTTTGLATIAISASNLSGGVMIVSGGTLTLVNISLPSAPIDGQQFAVSSNRQITALRIAVTPGSGASFGSSIAPTVLSLNTTGGPMAYRLVFHSADLNWYRLQ